MPPAPADQAASLRRAPPAAGRGAMAFSKSLACLAIASGKGGVGKTFVCVNLAVALAMAGRRVLLVDADLGLANADIVFGVSPKLSLQDAVFKGRPLAEVAAQTPYGVDLLAASSGAKEMVSLGEARMAMLAQELISFASAYDVLLFDCAAGIDSDVTTFAAAAPRLLVVATPQPTSIMDAYALTKLIHQSNPGKSIAFVVNMAESDAEGERVRAALGKVCKNYLAREAELLGVIPNSRNAAAALRARKPLVAFAEDDPASRRIRELAQAVLRSSSPAFTAADAATLAKGLAGGAPG